MQHFATEAESILGQLQGMDPDEGNTIIPGNDTPVKVLYGTSRVFFVPVAGGGYRKRTETPATMTRTQGLPPPAQNSKLIRTDQTPVVNYVVDSVDTTDPIDYIMTLVAHAV
jgi:hypothetical protein